MPKLFGLNILGVLIAAIAFYLVGYLWYGVVFAETWMNAAGLSEADFEGESPIWMIGGFVITVFQVVGLGLVMKWKGAATLGEAVQTALILWVVFALPFSHYAYLYTPAHDSTMLMIDASHLLVGWVVSAAILSMVK
ncbi:MAG: DUF1761 domain-containing protein [Parvularculaceae bacterium]